MVATACLLPLLAAAMPFWLKAALVGGAVFALVLFAVRGAILASLPEEAQPSAVPDTQVPEVVRRIVDRFFELGFERDGPALEFRLATRALVVPLVHERDGTYANVMRFHAQPVRDAFECVTLLEAEVEAGLTTSHDVGAGALPCADGELLQILPRVDVDTLHAAHATALEELRGRGIVAKPLRRGVMDELLSDSLRRKRALFLRAPWRFTLRALWRTVTKRSPHVGALATQPQAQRQLARLADPFARARRSDEAALLR